jgi:hypothetical protein
VRLEDTNAGSIDTFGRIEDTGSIINQPERVFFIAVPVVLEDKSWHGRPGSTVLFLDLPLIASFASSLTISLLHSEKK